MGSLVGNVERHHHSAREAVPILSTNTEPATVKRIPASSTSHNVTSNSPHPNWSSLSSMNTKSARKGRFKKLRDFVGEALGTHPSRKGVLKVTMPENNPST